MNDVGLRVYQECIRQCSVVLHRVSAEQHIWYVYTAQHRIIIEISTGMHKSRRSTHLNISFASPKGSSMTSMFSSTSLSMLFQYVTIFGSSVHSRITTHTGRFLRRLSVALDTYVRVLGFYRLIDWCPQNWGKRALTDMKIGWQLIIWWHEQERTHRWQYINIDS